MTTDKQSYPTDLNDDQWQLIADLLPPPEPLGRKPTVKSATNRRNCHGITSSGQKKAYLGRYYGATDYGGGYSGQLF